MCRDLYGDGKIVNGSQLFGTFTRLKDGSLAANGFQALAEFDLNKDGIVDQAEAKLAGIYIWKDSNCDGITDPGELLTLGQAGVTGVETGYIVSSDKDAHGNILRWVGSFMRADGSIGSAIDALFRIKK